LDGIQDIVAAMFNSTIVAYNGSTFEPIWNYTVPNSEVISIPIPGYYNDDDIPDFMVKYQIGAGFPTYYYTIAMIVDGRNGEPLLEKPMEDSLSRQMSGLSITVDGFGNDWFLHWSADCLNYEGAKEKYQFFKDQSLVSQTRADLCKLRFNSTLTTRLLALSQHVGPPGISLYFSEDWKSVEFNNSINPRKEAEKYLDAHPQFKIMDTYADIPFVSERSSRVYKNHRKNDIFKHKDNNILTEIGKYDSNAVYDNFDEFKNHKKYPTENDAVENLDADQTWKHDKWMNDNIQSDKEYDGLYGSDDVNNEDGEQNVDYPQTEIREQRSIANGIKDFYSTNPSYEEQISKTINDYFISSKVTQRDSQLNENIHITEKKEIEKINDKRNDTINTVNTSMVSVLKFQEVTSTMSNKLGIKKTIAIQSTSNVSIITNDSIEIEKNLNYNTSNIAHTRMLGITENQMIIDRQDTITSTEKTIDMTQQRHIYKHSFPNIIRDTEDDASIEKIFKRESLKNQNKGKLSKKKQILISSSIVDKNYKIRQKRGIRRKSKTNQPSDINGIQRQPPTGILLPSIAESKDRTSIDLVFSTFWLPSSEVSLILSQIDLECIHRKKTLLENKLQYKKDDDIISECLSERGVNYRLYQESMDRENTKISLGQMTIYRMKLECVCPKDMLPNQTCKNISVHQNWPEHLGSSGNGYFKPLHRSNI